ncbi:YdeI family protein [Massilia sp. H6]|uniref:YdeI/OmpD-associated family protein n=1 Tax=Massilia sp. H6 TaxID=2970464 RepID=UPI0021678D5A|nr:YdeI/OmpD-associated family protein [Massilia sp. H6]UVW28045.1 YdeI/OmpD-associated family protein [Massilia sp. H6]
MIRPTFFTDAPAFRSWLAANATTATELLVGFYKPGSAQPCLSFPESVDEALCFGWIDGRRKRIDDDSYVIRFTPRRPASAWSTEDIARIDRLRAEGKMLAAGEAAFALRMAAKPVVHAPEKKEAAQLAPDERAAFQRNRAAWDYFQALPPGYRNAILHWVTSARKEQTRTARLAGFIAACAAGDRLA